MTDTTNAANSSPITAECAANTMMDWRGQLEALIDIYDDAHNNDPESRCYIDGAFAEQMAEARAFLKAAPQPQGGALTDEQRTVILDAMRSLANRADELKESNTSIDGTWYDAEEKAQYDAEVQLIERLRVLAQSAPLAPQQAGDGLTAADNCEGWEALAIALCEEEGHEPFELLWDGGPVPEPWGDRWMKYEGDAKRMIELVRTHVSIPSDGLSLLREIIEHDDAWEKESRDSRISTSRADEYLAKFVELKDKARAILAAPRQPGEMGAGVQMDDAQEKAIADAATMKWMFIDVMAAFATGNRLTERLQAAYDWCERSGMVKKYQTMAKAPTAPAQQDERQARRFNEDAERAAFEDVIRSLTDPKNHHDDLARDEYAHDDYVQWPTALAWEAWKARAIQVQADAGAVDDATRFTFMVAALVADLNGEKLAPQHEAMRGCLEEIPDGTITVDHVRAAIDAAMSREQSQEKGGERG